MATRRPVVTDLPPGRPRPDVHIVEVGLPGPCGVRDHTALLATLLEERGSCVEVSSLVDDGRSVRRTLLTAARLARLALACRPGDRVLWQYASYTYAFRGISFPGTAFGLLCRLRGAHVVTFLHEPAATWERGSWRRALHVLSQAAALRLVLAGTSTPVVTTDQRVAQVRRLGRRDVRLVPVYSNIAVHPAGALEGDGRFTIGVLSYGAGRVRPDLLFGALALLGWDDARVVLLGGPGPASPAAERWRAEAAAVGRLDALELTGVLPADDLSRWISTCDVFAQIDQLGASSRRGTVAAMLAHGRPVLSLDGPDRWERLVEEDVVSTVPATVEAVAAGLAALRSSPARRAELGARAVAFYERHMTADLSADALAGMLATPVPQQASASPGAPRPPGSR